MNKIILLFCLCFSCCALSVNQPLSVQPQVQTDQWAVKWWMPRHQEKLLLKKQMKRVDLVFLGDSITHAWDDKGQKVWQQYYAKRHGLNIGFSGDRTENVLWRLENGEVSDINPKLVVLMIGTNNTGHRQDSAADTALGIQRIIDSLEAKLPSAKVLLLAIFPRGANVDDPLRKINDEINQIIQHYDDGERVHYMNINHIFLDHQGNLSQSVMKDLLHPNVDQYQVWAEAMESKIQFLLKD